MNPDVVELYKDIVRIGIPVFAGLIADLIAFFLKEICYTRDTRII